MGSVLLKVPIDDGSSEYVEVEIDPRQVSDAIDLIADDRRSYIAASSLRSSFSRLIPAINAALTSLRAHPQAPDEISMEMGVSVGGETGLIFTKGTAEAVFTITATWRKPPAVH